MVISFIKQELLMLKYCKTSSETSCKSYIYTHGGSTVKSSPAPVIYLHNPHICMLLCQKDCSASEAICIYTK